MKILRFYLILKLEEQAKKVHDGLRVAMRREVFIHASFLFTFFVFIHLVKRWFSLSFYPLWLGGILGTILPDIDHLLYIYFTKPDEPESKKARELIKQKKLKAALMLLLEGRRERRDLIFHTAFFQLIFLILTFLVITSSGSIFGRGLVLGFGLHLLVDQLLDILEKGDLSGWFTGLNFQLNKDKTTLYWAGNAIALLIFSFLL